VIAVINPNLTSLFAMIVSGETLEVEVNELTKGLQDIQKDIEEITSNLEQLPGDRFGEIMTVSLYATVLHVYTCIPTGMTLHFLNSNNTGVCFSSRQGNDRFAEGICTHEA
jgi:tetrahydromethanopterin S-methyltransferase subunit G